MGIGIENIDYYLPRQTVSSKDLAQKFGFPLDFVEKKIGIRKIHIAGDDEMSSDLAAKAIKKLLKSRSDIKNKIKALVVCTQTPDYTLPHTSAIVQKKVGLGNSIACFDIGLGCSGFVYGLSILQSFMESNGFEYGILVTAETYSKIINNTDKNTKPLFSDGAAATLLGPSPFLSPQRYTFGTNGNKYEALIVRPESNANLSKRRHLYMDGRGIFELMRTEVYADIKKCLSSNNLKLSDIDYFIFHQASTFMINTLSKQFGIDSGDRIVNCMNIFGNTVSSSIPMAIKLLYNRKLKYPLRILISGFGVGLSWSSTVLIGNGGELTDE